MADTPDVSARWSGRRIRIKARRGAVTTEATLTEAEAAALFGELGRVLYPPRREGASNG